MSAAFTRLLALEQQYGSYTRILPASGKKLLRQETVIFCIAKQQYSIAISQLNTIVLWPKINTIPGTVMWFLGVSLVHNQLITVNDLSGFMTGNLIKPNTGKYLMVFKANDLIAGLLVNNLSKVADYLHNNKIKAFDLEKIAVDPKFINVRG